MCVPGTGYPCTRYLDMHRYLYCTGTRVHEPVGIYRPRYLVFINNVNNKSDLYPSVLIPGYRYRDRNSLKFPRYLVLRDLYYRYLGMHTYVPVVPNQTK